MWMINYVLVYPHIQPQYERKGFKFSSNHTKFQIENLQIPSTAENNNTNLVCLATINGIDGHAATPLATLTIAGITYKAIQQ